MYLGVQGRTCQPARDLDPTRTDAWHKALLSLGPSLLLTCLCPRQRRARAAPCRRVPMVVLLHGCQLVLRADRSCISQNSYRLLVSLPGCSSLACKGLARPAAQVAQLSGSSLPYD